MHFMMEMQSELCISIFFLFPLLFLMGGASASPGGNNMPQADATPHFGKREVAPPMRHQSRWENIQVRRNPGIDVPMTKASGGRPVRQTKRGDNMAARLTDRQKKKILADYVQTNNYCATAKLNGVSANTVKKIVQTNADIAEKLIRKKEENTADVLTYMESQRDVVCQIIGKGLAVLNDPAKLAEATPSQITTAIGTLIDKWTLLQEKTANDDSERVRVIIDV